MRLLSIIQGLQNTNDAKNKLSSEQIAELNNMHNQGMPISRIAKQFKITRPTVYSYLKKDS